MDKVGKGMPLDADTARALLQLIAETEAAAYTERGRLAEQGIDEPIDPSKARQLYHRASVAARSAEALRQVRRLGQVSPRVFG